MRITFMEYAEEGLLSNIDDEIDAWHTSDTTLSLSEWLGMTEAEYKAFVEDADALFAIVETRRCKIKGSKWQR